MIDFKQTEEGDLDLATGDLVMVEPTAQHKADILMASQGDFADSPLLGVGIINYLNSEDNPLMLRDIARAMERDGMTIRRVGFEGNNLLIDGQYETGNS